MPLASLALAPPDWDLPSNVMAWVSGRKGGVSSAPYESLNLALHVGDNAASVHANRRLVASALDASLQWQWLQQVHSDKVVRVNTPVPDIVADGVITSAPGLACCVLTADCLSVFFAAKDGSEVALAHAGWRGLASGIIANTVLGMSVPAEQLLVCLGPAIGPCHFEVGAEVPETFLRSWAGVIPAAAIADCFHSLKGTPKFMADLFRLARLQLAALGVQSVAGGSECTYCEQDKYYSYRRSGTTGRMLSMICLKPAL